MSLKIERINSMFVKEISYILANEIKDKDIKFVTITACDVTNDLSYAKVYLTCMNENKETVLKELRDSEGYLRSMLANRIDIRHTPELIFEYDNSIEYAKRIESVIEKIHEGE